MNRIAVLIPCYNESQTIGKVVRDFREVLPEADIYVYDSNSTDGTNAIARAAGAIVRYERRQGKGHVIRTMFREIEADCYLMIDGDEKAANRLKEILAEAGTNVVDQVLYVKGGLPIIGGSVKPDEKATILAWVENVIANLK